MPTAGYCIFVPSEGRLGLISGAERCGMASIRNLGRFLGEFLLHPTKTGAIAPSSQYLAKAMVDWIDLPAARAVIEYGPGTGVFTGSILGRMRPEARFAAIELNGRLAESFRRRYPDVSLVEDSVANVVNICGRLGIGSVDCIVCGLPWASFPETLQRQLLDRMMEVLSERGQFVTFAYLQGLLLPAGKRFAGLLPQYFSHVSKSPTVWLNIPPAFVYRCGGPRKQPSA
jgi:phosphatidylethanolamine/phosphatidyl-N-methylethanolamine N-methyltransferase